MDMEADTLAIQWSFSDANVGKMEEQLIKKIVLKLNWRKFNGTGEKIII